MCRRINHPHIQQKCGLKTMRHVVMLSFPHRYCAILAFPGVPCAPPPAFSFSFWADRGQGRVGGHLRQPRVGSRVRRRRGRRRPPLPRRLRGLRRLPLLWKGAIPIPPAGRLACLTKISFFAPDIEETQGAIEEGNFQRLDFLIDPDDLERVIWSPYFQSRTWATVVSYGVQ